MIRNRIYWTKNYRTSANVIACSALLMLAMLATSCASSEAPVAEGEAAEATAEATEMAEAQQGTASPAANSMAPSTSRPASSAPSQTSSRPSGNAATNSSTSGWGDQPKKPMQAVETKPAAPIAKTYTLPAGSTLRVRTTSTMSTKTLESGATFAGSLDAPLEVDGKVIAERGANVTGRVVNSDPGGRVKGRALLQVAVTQVQLVNGEMASVSTSSFEQLAESSTKKDAAKVAIGSGIGAAIGAIAGGGKGAAIGAGVGAGAGTGTVLATRGNDAVIPAESTLTFNTQGPISVTLP